MNSFVLVDFIVALLILCSCACGLGSVVCVSCFAPGVGFLVAWVKYCGVFV